MALKGAGAKFSYETTPGGGSYTDISEVVSIGGGFGGVSNDIKTSHLLSTEEWHTFIAGFKDGGEITFVLRYTDNVVAALQGIVGVSRLFKITWRDTATLVCSGYYKGQAQDTPLEEDVTFQCTVKLSGKPVYTEVP